MSHYFETPDTVGAHYQVEALIWGQPMSFTSSDGVFSCSRLDPGTSVLFRLTDPPVNRSARILDLGCGYGAIGLALASHCPDVIIDAVDTNQQALELTKANAARMGLSNRVNTYLPEQVPIIVQYDEIWSNPPIRIGKSALQEMMTRWLSCLTESGQAKIVIGKNLGADSFHTWLQSTGWSVQRVGSSKGFRVLLVQR